MVRQFFYLDGERIDDLYCLRQLFRLNPQKQQFLISELMGKYASGIFSAWLQHQIYDTTRDASGQNKSHFKALRNQWLDMKEEEDRKQIWKLLCELCDVDVSLVMTERSEAEDRKRAKLSVFSWYENDAMENVKNWDYVVLEASELKETMGNLLLSELEEKEIHICNTGDDEYELKGLKLPGVRIVGHGRPVCVISDPKLNAAAELDLEKIPGLVLEGIILTGKCSLTGQNEKNWISSEYRQI